MEKCWCNWHIYMQASFKHAEVEIGMKMSKEIITGKWWYTELQRVLRNALFWRGCLKVWRMANTDGYLRKKIHLSELSGCSPGWSRLWCQLTKRNLGLKPCFADMHSFFLEVGSYELIGNKSSHRFNFSSALSLHQLEMPEKEKDHSAWVSLRMTKLLERCRHERQVQPWDAFSEVLPMQGGISSSVVHWMRPCGVGNTAHRFG